MCRTSGRVGIALACAVFVELPLAVVSLLIAHRAVARAAAARGADSHARACRSAERRYAVDGGVPNDPKLCSNAGEASCAASA